MKKFLGPIGIVLCIILTLSVVQAKVPNKITSKGGGSNFKKSETNEKLNYDKSKTEVVKSKDKEKVPYRVNNKDEAVKEFSKVVKNKEGIDNYKKSMVNKIKSIKEYYSKKSKEYGAKDHFIKSTITFNEPVSEEQIKNFVKKYKIKVTSVDLSFLENDSNKTIEIVWGNKFENVVPRFKEKTFDRDINIIGFTAIYGEVKINHIDSIENDENSIVDVSADVVLTNVKDAIYVPSLYNYTEKEVNVSSAANIVVNFPVNKHIEKEVNVNESNK